MVNAATSMSLCIQVFARQPIAGFCNTRLIPELGVKRATELHANMVISTVKRLSWLEQVDTQLWCKPDRDADFFKKIEADNAISLYNQQGDDLGEIMYFAARKALSNYDAVIQLGTDCPSADANYIYQALRQMDSGFPFVIGPANDGGYVLLLLTQIYPGIFNGINWGTASVLSQLTANLESNQFEFALLTPLDDIDTYQDYLNWQQQDRVAHCE